MSDREKDISQIMDDIAAGLIDDPIEDYKYLLGELDKYRSHELAAEINQEITKIMLGDLAVAARNELTGSHETASFAFMLDQAEIFVCSGQWGPAEMLLRNLLGNGLSIEDKDG